MKVPFVAKVQRVVVDTVLLNVEADSAAKAVAKAERVLHRYPASHEETGVDYCYVENRDTLEATVLSVEERKDTNVA